MDPFATVPPAKLARDFVIQNESQGIPGRIGDYGNAAGLYQLDRRYGFKELYNALPSQEQEVLFPGGADPAIFDPGKGGRPFNKEEQASISKWLTSPAGKIYEARHYNQAYELPAFQLATQHATTPGQPEPELQAMMLDMYTQRGPVKAQELLKGKKKLTAGQLIDTELADLPTLAKTSPGGAADILYRRVRGADRLDIDINPGQIYKTALSIIDSPKWADMKPNQRKAYTGTLKATVRLANKRYPVAVAESGSVLTTLSNMLGLKMPKSPSIDERLTELIMGRYDNK